MFGKQHFESVLIGGIVRARDHNSRIGFAVGGSKIKHRRRAKPDTFDKRASGSKPFNQSGLEHWRMCASVIAHNDAFTACASDHRAESFTQSKSIDFV